MKFIPVARLGQRREEGRAGGGSCGSGRRGLRRRGRVHQVGWEGGGLVRRGEDALVRVGGGPGLFGRWGLLLGSEGRVGPILGLVVGLATPATPLTTPLHIVLLKTFKFLKSQNESYKMSN